MTNRYDYLDLARGAEWIIHHPLGFKQHPLEDAGMYAYMRSVLLDNLPTILTRIIKYIAKECDK